MTTNEYPTIRIQARKLGIKSPTGGLGYLNERHKSLLLHECISLEVLSLAVNEIYATIGLVVWLAQMKITKIVIINSLRRRQYSI